jgi:hypothetical protein
MIMNLDDGRRLQLVRMQAMFRDENLFLVFVRAGKQVLCNDRSAVSNHKKRRRYPPGEILRLYPTIDEGNCCRNNSGITF